MIGSSSFIELEIIMCFLDFFFPIKYHSYEFDLLFMLLSIIMCFVYVLFPIKCHHDINYKNLAHQSYFKKIMGIYEDMLKVSRISDNFPIKYNISS